MHTFYWRVYDITQRRIVFKSYWLPGYLKEGYFLQGITILGFDQRLPYASLSLFRNGVNIRSSHIAHSQSSYDLILTAGFSKSLVDTISRVLQVHYAFVREFDAKLITDNAPDASEISQYEFIIPRILMGDSAGR